MNLILLLQYFFNVLLVTCYNYKNCTNHLLQVGFHAALITHQFYRVMVLIDTLTTNAGVVLQ